MARCTANRAGNKSSQLRCTSKDCIHSFKKLRTDWQRNMCDCCHCLLTYCRVGMANRIAVDAHLLQTSRRTHHSVRCVALQLLYLRLDGQPSKEVSHPHIWHVRAEALELVADLQQAQ